MAPLSALERSLRLTTAIAFIPAFALIIPAGINNFEPPLYGFIGHGFSLILALFYFARIRRNKNKLPSLTSNIPSKDEKESNGTDLFIWTMDFFTAGAYFGLLVPIWVLLPEDRYLGRGDIMLVTYSTVPMMMNMVVHILLFSLNLRMSLRYIVLWLLPTSSRPSWLGARECPHCHHSIEKKGRKTETKECGEGYSLLRGEDCDDDAVPRASEESTVGKILDV